MFTRLFHSTHILLFIKQAPTSYSGKFFRRKIAPLGTDFYFVLVLYSGRLCPFLTPHSSFLTYTPPHKNLKPAAELLDHGFQAIIYKWDGGNFIG